MALLSLQIPCKRQREENSLPITTQAILTIMERGYKNCNHLQQNNYLNSLRNCRKIVGKEGEKWHDRF